MWEMIVTKHLLFRALTKCEGLKKFTFSTGCTLASPTLPFHSQIVATVLTEYNGSNTRRSDDVNKEVAVHKVTRKGR